MTQYMLGWKGAFWYILEQKNKKNFIPVLILLFTCKIIVLISLIADEWKHETDLYCKSNVKAINLVHSFIHNKKISN